MSSEELVIEPGGNLKNYWRDLWTYRELFYFLAWRDLAVRYKQTAIGVAWGVLRPVITMAVFVVVFGKLAKLPSNGVPYAILVFSAMLPWQLFANALAESSNSLVSNANLISKVYFPRLAVPTSSIIVSLVDFLISLLLLALMVAWYRFTPGWQMLALPVFTLVGLVTAMGAGLWFAALNVKYRDVRFVIPFIVQLGIYISPVGFSSRIVPAKWRLIYSLNPLVGVIDGFRWSIIGRGEELFIPGFILSVSAAVALLVTGLWYFRKTERSFADVI